VGWPLHPRGQLELGATSRAARAIKGVAEVLSSQAAEDAPRDGPKASSSWSEEETCFGSEECSRACTADATSSFPPVFSEVDKAHTAGWAVNVYFVGHG